MNPAGRGQVKDPSPGPLGPAAAAGPAEWLSLVGDSSVPGPGTTLPRRGFRPEPEPEAENQCEPEIA